MNRYRSIFVLLVIALVAIAPLEAQYSNRLKINHAHTAGGAWALMVQTKSGA